MIYRVENLKVNDWVITDTDYHKRGLCNIAKGTRARICDVTTYGSLYGLEFNDLSATLICGHDCFGAGKGGCCLWVPETDLINYFSYVPIMEDRACATIKELINGIYGSPIVQKTCESFPGFGGHTWLSYDEWIKENTNPMTIEKVIFNDPATIVLWKDGSKTVVKAENEPFDKEKGLAMAISKKALGNKGNYYDTFKDYIK